MAEDLQSMTGLVGELCRAAAGRDGCEARRDPLDGSVWASLESDAAVEMAVQALTAHGIASRAASPGRVHAMGWDARLLRRRLGVALAGVDDLMAEWGATAELARYAYDRRAAGTGEAEVWEVLGDVERTMRSSAPLPHTAPRIDDIPVLLTLIGEAEDAYQRLIGEHLEHAERVLADHVADHAAACAAPVGE